MTCHCKKSVNNKIIVEFSSYKKTAVKEARQSMFERHKSLKQLDLQKEKKRRISVTDRGFISKLIMSRGMD